MTDFYSLKVPELKQYQHERGVISSLGGKLDFVRLCELAEELNLIIPADDWGDYKVMCKRRRTVQLNDNSVEIPSLVLMISSFFPCVCMTILSSTVTTRFRTHSLITHFLDADRLHRKYQRIRKFPNHGTEVCKFRNKTVSRQ